MRCCVRLPVFVCFVFFRDLYGHDRSSDAYFVIICLLTLGRLRRCPLYWILFSCCLTQRARVSPLQLFILYYNAAMAAVVRAATYGRSADWTLTRLVTVGDRTFSAAGSRLWNSLPRDVTECQTLAAFRRKLKHFLFSLSFPGH